MKKMDESLSYFKTTSFFHKKIQIRKIHGNIKGFQWNFQNILFHGQNRRIFSIRLPMDTYMAIYWSTFMDIRYFVESLGVEFWEMES